MTGPSHSLPPCFGSGFVHDRVRSCFPNPQVVEHSSNDVHAVNPPLTKEKENKQLNRPLYSKIALFLLRKILINFSQKNT